MIFRLRKVWTLPFSHRVRVGIAFVVALWRNDDNTSNISNGVTESAISVCDRFGPNH